VCVYTLLIIRTDESIEFLIPGVGYGGIGGLMVYKILDPVILNKYYRGCNIHLHLGLIIMI